jgi:hypothetical protein
VTALDQLADQAATAGPALPGSRGPLSACVLAALRRGGPPRDLPPVGDPYGEDAQLTLYCLYELHYRGFAGVDPEREWDLDLLRVRRGLERAFLTELRADVPPGDDVEQEVAGLLTEPVDAEGTGVSHHLLRAGEAWQLREYLAHRSIYHLKEADPQAWVIRPRRHSSPWNTTSTAPAIRSACMRGCSPRCCGRPGWTTATGCTWTARRRRRWPRST